ncbi:MAG: Na/Pi cotransporter family protein [Fibrobacterota bacterium]
MSPVDILNLICGLSLFLFGMDRSSKGLRLAAGNSLRQIIEKLTRFRLAGLGVGITATALTQSSSATTVMLVGFASAGLITLKQALSIILGADIGTTITVQLFAWKITKLAPFFISAGFFTRMFSKNPVWKNTGRLILGFGLIFFGMEMMSASVSPLRESVFFRELLSSSSGPAAGIFISAAFTALIQSSAATIALVLALAVPGESGPAITLTQAVPLVLGANIGTCATALLAAFRNTAEARRIAWAHTIFKISGVLLFIPLISLLEKTAESVSNDLPHQIANIHTIFNVFMALLFLPFLKNFSALTKWLIKPDKENPSFDLKYISRDYSYLPEVALQQASREIERMSSIVLEMASSIPVLLEGKDFSRIKFIKSSDDKVDFLHKRISLYISKLSEDELSVWASRRQGFLLTACSHIELAGDVISKNISAHFNKMSLKGIFFSKEGLEDILVMTSEVIKSMRLTFSALSDNDTEKAKQVLESRNRIEELEDTLSENHFRRLNAGLKETVQSTTVHLDLLDDIKNINNHCIKISEYMVNINIKEKENDYA